ncbi:hypothetical protein IE53DRAFT_385517 [Violaceomyces palustris]|uniref:Uncharacterized protein n=1 Tax=Violaceomyces palustris TaxID=1673888 RepID=A0ACD0P239_9BASI|nr:hypothetical protein IE53DRAFT_385517 [Violaceomyces palustris]
MPKVISRSTISASNDQQPSNTSPLKVYYCLCGEFSLVCDRPLESLPQRPLDGSRVLRCLDSSPGSSGGVSKVRKARVFKISASQGRPKLLQRPDGSLEKQYPFHCSRCNLQIGYEHTPPPLKSGGKFTFILPGALSERHGQVPEDALLGIENLDQGEAKETSTSD